MIPGTGPALMEARRLCDRLEQRDRRAQLQRVDFAEDLLRGTAGQTGEDSGAFDQPCAKNRMGQVGPGLFQ